MKHEEFVFDCAQTILRESDFQAVTSSIIKREIEATLKRPLESIADMAPETRTRLAIEFAEAYPMAIRGSRTAGLFQLRPERHIAMALGLTL